MKRTLILLAAILFYICLGFLAGVIHAQTGSFAAASAETAASDSVKSTVVGQILSPSSPAEGDASETEENASEASDETEDASASDISVETAEEIHYYRFTTVTKIQRLHLRAEPSLTAEILSRLDKGTTGYIIAAGTDWSYLITDAGQTGYCFNGYLSLTEISPEEYPEELKTTVPPVEP